MKQIDSAQVPSTPVQSIPFQSVVSNLPEVIKAELELAGVPLSNLLCVEKLSHGLSNQNYLLKSRERKWVLRINSVASSHICNRDSEVTNWKIAAEQGLAPELQYVSTDNKYYLSEYIEQDEARDWGALITAHSALPLPDEQEHWHKADTALLSLLNHLARLKCPDNLLSVSEQWRIYSNALTRINTANAEQSVANEWQRGYSRLLSIQETISHWLMELESCALAEQYSHRDLNPHNLLFSQGKLTCIDFEYACGSHPLFDLAGVLSSHALSTSQRSNIIDGYLDNHPKLTPDAKSALPAAINIYWVFAACWALLMAAETDNKAKDKCELQHSPQTRAKYLDCFSQFFSLIVS
ncbi:phosphotransferase [Shewanella sp. UCD-KL12]|uniref:phosphotransferase n=1 Tax=Shewanella sp. UCD-KL12 TaxID=1917163 RepID=UPI002115F214|nr:phosphotransferase [Shewanella sp. UCD-KL12]